MHSYTDTDRRGGRSGKTIMFIGATLTMLAGMALSAQAKTHDIKMTAVETDIVIDGGWTAQ